ncbi:hypothetical protein C8R46DRAFT_1052986, partial [Mycena filopes]
MLKGQTQLNHIQFSSNKSAQSATNSQHGLLLLHLPSESLTHVTSFLDPKSLLSLAQCHSRLSDHIKDDHTWHRAFVYQLLRIGPETDLNNAKCLLLRRSHLGSWRQEFIVYFSLRRRWERSRNTTTAHVPLHSAVSSMHLMPAHGLISSSLQYGVVSRSLPFTGRILRGYLDAAGSGTGLGIGNPNTDFTPNVSVCALGSDGGTAKIAWGFRNGEVAFTSANKAMDAGSRSAAKFSRCTVGDEHQGIVLDVGTVRVKVWDSKKTRCVWTSEGRAPDECIKVASALSKRLASPSEMTEPVAVDVFVIPCPIHEDGASHEISDNHLFYRFDIDFSTGAVECAAPGELSLIITGTQLGCVGIYDWTDPTAALPAYKFEAALAWNGLRGVTKVWDALTLEHLRTFPSPGMAAPAEDPSVRQIVLGPEKEVLLVAVGDRVMATRSTPGKKKERAVTSKYHQQIEMNQAIVESRHLLDEESAHVQRAYGREREQRTQLETLGLDEVEAVEYVLMLSREEAIERESSSRSAAAAIDQGVFEGDFDDDGFDESPSRASSRPSSAASSPPRASPPSSPPRAGSRPIPRASGSGSGSNSNSKIQVSPPLRAEPTEALFTFTPSPPRAPAAATATHFPPISSSGGSAS